MLVLAHRRTLIVQLRKGFLSSFATFVSLVMENRVQQPSECSVSSALAACFGRRMRDSVYFARDCPINGKFAGFDLAVTAGTRFSLDDVTFARCCRRTYIR